MYKISAQLGLCEYICVTIVIQYIRQCIQISLTRRVCVSLCVTIVIQSELRIQAKSMITDTIYQTIRILLQVFDFYFNYERGNAPLLAFLLYSLPIQAIYAHIVYKPHICQYSGYY